MLHGNPIEHVGMFHSPLTVSNDDELRIFGKVLQILAITEDVGIIQGRLHFVQDTEGNRTRLQDGKQERNGSKGPLPPG